MYFKIKNILKNNCYYTLKHPINKKNFFFIRFGEDLREREKIFFLYL